MRQAYKNYIRRRIAFTLAEVLITLAVIGVVASMSIPALQNSVDDMQYKSAYKKTYSVVNLSLNQLLAENGGTFKNILNDADDGGLANLFLPYLNFTKSCITIDAVGNCWHSHNKFYYMNGTPTLSGTNGGFILTDGSFFAVRMSSMACTDVSLGVPSGYSGTCGQYWLDVNGFKGPNRIGRDIFGGHILKNTIKPYGTPGDIYDNTCRSTSTGESCSTEYLLNQ